MASFKGLGNSDNFMDTLSDLEKEIKSRQKEEKDKRFLVNSKDDKTEAQLEKLYAMLGKNNKEVTKQIKVLVDNQKISLDTASEWVDKIKESAISNSEWKEVKELWLEEAERNKENDGEKKKELTLWNVLRAGIRGLIPDDTGKKAKEVWNVGMKTLGVKFFKDLSKNFGKYIAEGLKFFGMMSLWTLIIFGLLAFFDPNGTLITTIIEGIKSLLPVIVGMLTNFIKQLPQILLTATQLFTRVVKELLPVLMSAIKTIVDILIKEIPNILLTIGKSMDSILSTIFGKEIKIFEPLMKVVGDIFTLLANTLVDLIPVIVDLLRTAIPPLLNIIGAIIPIVSEILKILLPMVVYLLKNVILPLINILFKILTPVLDYIKNALGLLKGILTFDKKLIVDSLKGMLSSYIKYLFTAIKTIFLDLPKLFLSKITIPIYTAIIKGILKMFNVTLPKGLTNALTKAKDSISNAVTGIGNKLLDIGEHPDKYIKELFNAISTTFKKLITWFKSGGVVKIIFDFFDMLKYGFFNLMYTIGGFFSYVKNRGFSGVLTDVATGKVGQQISAQTAQISYGEKIDLSNIAKMESDKALTSKEISSVKNQISKEDQKQFDEKIKIANKDNKVTPEEVLDIVKQLGIQQRIQQDKLGKVQEDIYSGKTAFDF